LAKPPFPDILHPVRAADFDYALPPELIAQRPAARRDGSRLLVLDRTRHGLSHRRFADLPQLLQRGDLLVLNDSRVIPARLRARKRPGGGQVEVLVTEEISPLDWWVMLRPGSRIRAGTPLEFLTRTGQPAPLAATVLEKNHEGLYRLQFSGTANLHADLDTLGEMPLPPYIVRNASGPTPTDVDRYQTVYARAAGSVAAPTAGLHFTHDLLARLRALEIEIRTLTLHVGPGTFAPVKTTRIADHRLHAERFTIGPQTARALNNARHEGRRIIAVGTTTVRVLEHLAVHHPPHFTPQSGTTSIFIHPPYRFHAVNALLTNFHLPRSTLIMLVCAFAGPESLEGREWILHAYQQAVQHHYRFYSYGDAMFIH
jgi:S-adenosylmethionine:tRNA ribosyltransferase-isomerase